MAETRGINTTFPEHEEKVDRAKRLNRSSSLEYHLCSDAEEVDALIDELHGLFVERTKPKRVQRKTDIPALKSLVLNLYKAHTLMEGWYVGYHRSPNGYRAKGQYNLCGVSKKIIDFVDAFEELGLVESVKGFYDHKNPERSRTARVRATHKLTTKFEDEYHFDPKMLYRHPYEESIRLRSSKKQLVPYGDTYTTTQMRENLGRINDLLERTSIKLNITPEQWEELNTRLLEAPKQENKRREPLDMSRVRLHRTFNDGRKQFDHGGRFYGGWWQNVFSDYRRHITINGLPTTEVDYSSLHPRILYAKKGVEAPDDCYRIQGLDERHRPVIKKAFLRMINARSDDSAKRSLRSDSADEVNAVEGGVDVLFEKIAQTHAPIGEYFGSGEGVKLQYLDSKVAEKVMLHFLEERNTPALPIHDSFIVPFVYEFELIEVMEREFMEEFEASGVAEAKYLSQFIVNNLHRCLSITDR